MALPVPPTPVPPSVHSNVTLNEMVENLWSINNELEVPHGMSNKIVCDGNGISLSTTLELTPVENEPITVVKFEGGTLMLKDLASRGKEFSKLPSISSLGSPNEVGKDMI